MRGLKTPIYVPIILAILLVYVYISQNPIHIFQNANQQISSFSVWHKCLAENISIYENDADGLWKNFWKGLKKCETLPGVLNLKIEDFSNSDETKRHIVTKVQLPSVIVTLGIGHDTAAEKKLIKKLPQGSEFFGADPMHEINEDLFTKLPGKYFPFAVGAESGIFTASVLKNNTYQDQNVVMIDIVYFLKDILKRKFVDDLWLDAEGAEYEIFEHFFKDGKFDKN